MKIPQRGYKMLKYEIVDNQKEEWVVFVHGIGGSTKTWSKQIDAFSEQYNLLLLDLPGHGQNADNVIYEVDSKKLHNGIKETMFAWIEYVQFTLHPEQILLKLEFLGKKILFISGDEDHCFIDDAKALAKKMRNTEMKIIEKCGHICSIEKWTTFNRIALDFLSNTIVNVRNADSQQKLSKKPCKIKDFLLE